MGGLRFERWRRRFWRWRVWIVFADGTEQPATRSGWWTQLGALIDAREWEISRDASGFRGEWAFVVRRIER